jgi:hypothetical protein
MKNVILIMAVVSALSSCKAVRGTETVKRAPDYGNSCEHPSYVASVTREADMVGGAYASGTLRLAVLLKEAQAKFGNDVTITNIYWDIQNGKRRSVIYDVVKCK